MPIHGTLFHVFRRWKEITFINCLTKMASSLEHLDTSPQRFRLCPRLVSPWLIVWHRKTWNRVSHLSSFCLVFSLGQKQQGGRPPESKPYTAFVLPTASRTELSPMIFTFHHLPSFITAERRRNRCSFLPPGGVTHTCDSCSIRDMRES
jgi:hypothetical protein